MSTYTFTGTDTYSVTDVKAVMQNTYEDIIGFANRHIITYETAKRWIEDITYILNEKALSFFEIQIYNATGDKFMAYKYKSDSNGYLYTGSASGGINYFAIPSGCKAGLLVSLDSNATNYNKVNNELDRRGFGQGSSMAGNEVHERNYVSNNLRLQRSVITK